MINDKMINDKLLIYSLKKIAIHVSKKNGEWLNGYVEEMSNDFFMLDEFKKGLMPVFFEELKYIETFKDGESK